MLRFKLIHVSKRDIGVDTVYYQAYRRLFYATWQKYLLIIHKFVSYYLPAS